MSDFSIRVENLSKMYVIGHFQQRQDTLRDLLVEMVKKPFSRKSRQEHGDQLWALKDVSFDVKQGEVLGIIGRNGAGKSTLLKILSRITEPTSGRAVIDGRVGSLLEVGTGFHPELTGRENIYLNGSLLGMRRVEIDRKFDGIVAFAEIEQFLDTPVKRYSSGMYVRLAFAVAAHLEPEILFIDEVLAVGDATFQKKCIGKISDVARGGRTVLFVSHNMIAMQSLCRQVIWIDHGKIVDQGDSNQVVANYLSASFTARTEQVWDDPVTAPGNEIVRLRRICIRPEGNTEDQAITMDQPTLIEVEFWNLLPGARLHTTLHLFDEHQIVAFTTFSNELNPEWQNHSFQKGLFRTVCHIPGNLLNSGLYRILLLFVQDGSKIIFRYEDAASFTVLELAQRKLGWMGREPGVVHPKLLWESEHIGDMHSTVE
jgi:lipopolysaccharide transport system ATP-binding protein